MSTNINGYIFRDNSLEEVLHFLHSQEKSRRKYVKQYLKKKFLDYLFMYLDGTIKIHDGQQSKPRTCINIPDMLAEFKDYVKAQSETVYNSEHDLTYELCLFPYDDNVYIIDLSGLPFNEYHNNVFYAHSYFYWDHSDRPDNVSEQEWEERKTTWDKVLNICGYSDIIGNNGLVYKPTKDDELYQMPSNFSSYKSLIEKQFNKESRIKYRLNLINKFRSYAKNDYQIDYYDTNKLEMIFKEQYIELNSDLWKKQNILHPELGNYKR